VRENRPGCRSTVRTYFGRKSKDGLIGRISREGFAQQRHIVSELFMEIAQVLGHIMVEEELHSEFAGGDQQINFAAVSS
jgi:hypothetical protein